jgi:septal ring factor EnvC (AmiA/AmiB activator)
LFNQQKEDTKMKDRIELLQKLIDENAIAQAQLKKQLNSFELDPDDYRGSFNELLDEDGPVFMNYYPSQILLRCDEIAYREGLNNHVDGLDISEVSEEYKELEQELEALLNEAQTLADMLGDLETSDDEY